MEFWKNSKMSCVYFSNDAADEQIDCEVTLDGPNILVEYSFEGEHVRYRGQEQGAGHYILSSPASNGEATLHRFTGSKFLDGYWSEDGVRGMWRIALISQ